MILVDTSVLITFLRTASPPILAVFKLQECCVCGVTRAEILHGARTKQDAQQLTLALNKFQQLPITDDIWDRLGENLATLRSAGVKVPFQDVLLATIAISHGTELWSHDQHFLMIQTHLPTLRLFLSTAI